ncbi:MAG: NAD(P)H-dependent flavin oxidoreductase [Candidatus Odinarchaeota archaeon]
MIWKTKINQLTGTKYPLVMAAFARISTIDFAAAFSNLGGLGIITALNFKIDNFKNELQRMHSLTEKPFGVNITVAPPQTKLAERFTEDDYLEYVEIALDEGVKIFTTSAYQAPFIGKRVHEAGGYWFHKCALIRHAISAEKVGADAITLTGLEAAGFKNPYQHSTLVNLTVAKRILNVPIIAAGGIGDARGFLGALTMGADAICLGTAILLTKESPLPLHLKEDWLNTNILLEDYHNKLYHFSLKGTRVPSPATAFVSNEVSLKDFIESLVNGAEKILKSWGFTKEEFNCI